MTVSITSKRDPYIETGSLWRSLTRLFHFRFRFFTYSFTTALTNSKYDL